MTHAIQYKQTCVLIQTFQRQTVTQDTTYCLSNPIKLYFIEYTYSIAHLTSWKWLLIVKIHRYWHFMSDTIWILHVSIPLCKSSHSQCDAGGEAAFFFFFFYCRIYPTTKQPYIFLFLHVLQSIQKWIYVHTDDFICTVFEMNKMPGLYTKTLLVRVNIKFMYVCFHVLQVEYKDPVMKCCMPLIICGIHTMQH